MVIARGHFDVAPPNENAQREKSTTIKKNSREIKTGDLRNNFRTHFQLSSFQISPPFFKSSEFGIINFFSYFFNFLT